MNSIKSIEYLKGKNVSFRVIKFAKIPKTAADVERIYNCPLREVLKALLFIGKDKPFLVVLEGDKRLDYKKLGPVVQEEKMRMARLEEVLEITGYSVGSVSPFSLKQDILKIMDNNVFKNKKINIGSGDPYAGIEMESVELRKAWDGRFAEISG
ncbi:MAG: YbaK/EbsC family protein [Patescibacteria group bacterium]|jgi:Cys-tRNA(Pro) deacylase